MELHARVVRYCGSAALDRHAHQQASVSVVLAGSIEEEVCGRTELGRMGSIVTKPAGIEHRNRVGREGAILLAIKGSHADTLAPAAWRWTQPRGAAAVGLEVARTLKLGGSVEPDQLLDLLGLADQTREAPPRRVWLNDIRSDLDREPNPPTVLELAQRTDVHPVYLARVFRKQFGCSIREYRRKQRVRRAADLLAKTDQPVAAVAASLGFFDQSHLCRDFRAELSVSPTAYRAILRS